MNERSFTCTKQTDIMVATELSVGRGDVSTGTRNKIVEAAYGLFVDRGYHGTSMRDIASAAGLSSVAGIYNHFVSKERIFARTLEAYHPLVRVMESVSKARGRTQQGLMRSMANNMIESLRDDPGMLNLMLIEFVEHGGTHIDDLQSVFVPQLMQVYQRVKSKKGRLRRMNAETMTQSLLGFVFSRVLFEWVFGSSESTNPKVLRKHLQLYLNGVMKPKTP